MYKQLKEVLDLASKEQNVAPKKELLSLIHEIKDKIEDSEKNEIIKSVLSYFCTDKPWKNEEFSIFSEKLCKLNYEDDNVEVILKYFENFNGILKYLISIDDIIKNKYIRCAMKFILISGEKKDLIDYFKKHKNVFNKEKEVQDILLMINFNNYIQINFIHELIRILFAEEIKKDNSNILEKIIININKKEYLRCEKCFDILYCYQKKNLLNFICNNKHLITLSSTQEKIETKIITILCKSCGSNKNIYENIFKCLSCNCFFCEKCKNNHEKKCFFCQYINLYQIGYMCEKHNKLYIDCCFFCNKNLCEDCKSSHYHISKPEIKKLLISDAEILKLINIKDKYNIKDYINYQYAILLKFIQINSYFNLKIFSALNFLNGYSRIYYIEDFYSQKFGDNKFKEYYKDLIERIKKGDRYALNDLEIMHNEYAKVKKNKAKNFNYNSLIEDSEKARKNKIRNFSKYFKYILIDIKKSYSRIDKALIEINNKKETISLKNEFNFFKIKNISLYNSNRLGEVYLRNLISRYFSDLIIAQLIDKYPTYFAPIQLSFINTYELLNNYGIEIVKGKTEKEMKSICNDLTILFKEHGNSNSKTFIDIFKPSNEIVFVKDLVIKDSIIKKEELNFILELFFYFKINGNEVAHPNIDKMKASLIKFIKKDCFNSENKEKDTNLNFNISIENINNFIKSDSDSEHSERREKVKNKLKEIVKIILNDFKEINYTKEINIQQILNFMVKNKKIEITKSNSLMIRILDQEIEKIINEENDIDMHQFEKYLHIINDFNNNISTLESDLKDIKVYLLDNHFKDINAKINFSINDLQDFKMYKIERILESFNSEYSSDMSENDINAIVLFIIGQQFLMMKNDFYLQIEKLTENIEEIIVEESIKNIIRKVYSAIENFFRDEKYYDTESDLIKKIKLKIIEKKNQSLFALDVDIEKIYNILEKLIGVDKFKWLESPISKNISLDSYLYYKQNV